MIKRCVNHSTELLVGCGNLVMPVVTAIQVYPVFQDFRVDREVEPEPEDGNGPILIVPEVGYIPPDHVNLFLGVNRKGLLILIFHVRMGEGVG